MGSWLFPEAAGPPGFVYRPDFLAEPEEQSLLGAIRGLEFSEVRLRGQVARRRAAHFGWVYGYQSWEVTPGPPIPDFLLPVRARAAELAGVQADDLVEALVTEYPPGAGIGWHRDAPVFGVVVGISLLGACRFRLLADGPDPARAVELTLEPRSAYVLAGEARWRWRHHIPPGRALRYSITFRTLRPPASRVGVRPASPAVPRGRAPGGPAAPA